MIKNNPDPWEDYFDLPLTSYGLSLPRREQSEHLVLRPRLEAELPFYSSQ